MMKNKSYLYAIICICPLISIFFYAIYKLGYTDLSLSTIHVISTSCLLLIMCSITSLFVKSPIYIICIITQIILCIIGSSENVILTSLFIFPIVLSFYTKKKSFTIMMIIVNIISYIISNCVKYTKVDPRNPIIGGILLGVIYTFELSIIIISLISYVKYIKKMNGELERKNKESLNTQKDMINFCINSLSYHSPYLRIHTQNVAFYTKLIIDELKLNQKYKDDCHLGALVHDIGKIYISDSILDKPSKLTDEEFAMIKSHVSKGVELFNSIPYNVIDRDTFQVCMNCIKYHHERLDGKGYTMGLSGNQIPLESKIISVADTMDALLSYRSYKSPKSFEQTLEILEDEKLFDQNIVKIIPSLKEEIVNYSTKSNEELKSLFINFKK